MPPNRHVRVTIKSVVLDGLRNGDTFEVIAERIVTGFPDSKGAQDPIRYIKYYQHEAGLNPKNQERLADEREAQGQPRVIAPLPKFGEVIDHIMYENVVVKIYRGLTRTYNASCDLSRKEIMIAYKCITGEYARPDASFYSVQAVVLGEIQNRWYEATGQPLPPRVEANQAQRLEDAKMAKKTSSAETATATKEAKEPRISIKSVITGGLLAGKSDEAIAEELTEMFPGKAAAKNPAQHISYYRSALVKDGQLEKQPRKTKTKAEAEEAETPAPAKGKKAAAPAAAAKGKKASK